MSGARGAGSHLAVAEDPHEPIRVVSLQPGADAAILIQGFWRMWLRKPPSADSSALISAASLLPGVSAMVRSLAIGLVTSNITRMPWPLQPIENLHITPDSIRATASLHPPPTMKPGRLGVAADPSRRSPCWCRSSCTTHTSTGRAAGSSTSRRPAGLSSTPVGNSWLRPGSLRSPRTSAYRLTGRSPCPTGCAVQQPRRPPAGTPPTFRADRSNRAPSQAPRANHLSTTPPVNKRQPRSATPDSLSELGKGLRRGQSQTPTPARSNFYAVYPVFMG